MPARVSALPQERSRRRLSTATWSVLILMLVVATFAALGTRSVVRDQESRLLNERAAEVGLLYTTSVGGLSSAMAADAGVLRTLGGSAEAFRRAVSAEVADSRANHLTLALLSRTLEGGFRVVAADGGRLKAGQVITGDRAAAAVAALQAGAAARAAKPQRKTLPISTRVMGSGVKRAVGFALDGFGIPGLKDPVLYRESSLGRISAGRQAGSASFHEVHVVVYAVPRPEPSQLLISTTGGALPEAGTRFVPELVGASHWWLGVRAKTSLVGGIASNAWWIVLLGGIGAAVLLATVIEFAVRRRDAALSLFTVEHQQAETLQRSLLPALPVLADVEVAARYQAGGVGQQVGGDWFDAFPLTSGGVGFAIGDVIGHDMEAAAAMSQIRSALRAYAYEGAEPSDVLSRLDRLICTFELTQLVSVVYGVLSPVGADGSRMLRFANAGHLPPMLQHPDGSVAQLTQGASVVIGAPYFEPREQASLLLEGGSTVLLFTDGLLEAPELSLSETIPELADTIAQHSPSAGPEMLCDRVLAERRNTKQSDDIALLALRLRRPAGKSPRPRASMETGEAMRPTGVASP